MMIPSSHLRPTLSSRIQMPKPWNQPRILLLTLSLTQVTNLLCLPMQSSQHISHQSKPHTTQPTPSHKISHFLSHHRSHFQSHHKATGTAQPPFCLRLQGEMIKSTVIKVMQSQGEPLLPKILPPEILNKMWEPTRTARLNCDDSQLMGNHMILPSMLISSAIGCILLLPLQIEIVWLSTTHRKIFCITFLPNAICYKTPGLMNPLACLWCLNTWFWIHGNQISMTFLIHAYLQHKPKHQNIMKTVHLLKLPHAVLFWHNSGRQWEWNSIPLSTNLISGTMLQTLVRMSCQAHDPSKSSITQMVVSRSLKHAFVQEATDK